MTEQTKKGRKYFIYGILFEVAFHMFYLVYIFMLFSVVVMFRVSWIGNLTGRLIRFLFDIIITYSPNLFGTYLMAKGIFIMKNRDMKTQRKPFILLWIGITAVIFPFSYVIVGLIL